MGVITKCDIAQSPSQVDMRNSSIAKPIISLLQLLNLARNTEKYFRHGWFVVRNRTPSEIQASMDPSERHIKESNFFSATPWNALSSERRGTQALKKYLAELLSNRILETFPTMLNTLRERVKSTTAKLEGLGSARGTLEEKRTFLTKIAQDFNSLASQALRGRYDSLSASHLKLRCLVREANETFSLDIKENGHTVPFFEQPRLNWKKENVDLVSAPTVPSSGKAKSSSSNLGGGPSGISFVGALLPFSKNVIFEEFVQREPGTRIQNFYQNCFMTGWNSHQSFEELRLSDYAHQQNPPNSNSALREKIDFSSPTTPGKIFSFVRSDTSQNVSPAVSATPSKFNDSGLFAASLDRHHSDIYRWITEEVQANQGTELQGTFNPDILPALFHKQIVHWKSFSKAHFFLIAKVAVQSLVAILDMTCPDPHVRGRLEKAIRRVSDAAEQKGLKQLSERITTLTSSHLQTNNSAFVDKVRTARLQRFQAALERHRSKQPAELRFMPQKPDPVTGYSFADDTKLTIDVRDTVALFDEIHVSNAQNLADEIHDVLKAYYEIARDDFVEYVNHLIVEPYLNAPDGPVLFFSPLYVSGLAPEKLEALAIEEVALVRERTDLVNTLVRLKRAEAIALKYS